jgi:hypothetical protein
MMLRTTASKTFKFVRPKHIRNSKRRNPDSTNTRSDKCHDTPQLIDDECTKLHFAADRSQKSLETRLDDTQRPIEAQPDSLREPLREKRRPRFARAETGRATRQDAECAWRISGTAARRRRKRPARRFFCAVGCKNAENGKNRTPIVPWVARDCLVLFFFDA